MFELEYRFAALGVDHVPKTELSTRPRFRPRVAGVEINETRIRPN